MAIFTFTMHCNMPMNMKTHGKHKAHAIVYESRCKEIDTNCVLSDFLDEYADDDEDIPCLLQSHSEEEIPYVDWEKKWEWMSNSKCKKEFRFEKGMILEMQGLLHIPHEIILENRSVVSGNLALCMMLKVLAYPTRLLSIVDFFGRCTSDCSRIISYTIKHVYLLTTDIMAWDTERLTPEVLEKYAGAVAEAGAPVKNCFGFIDGTVRGTARPMKRQRVVYNGHKRKHALKYQSITAPDGLCIHLHGPQPGTRHDARMYRESGLPQILEECAYDTQGNSLCLYGDPAYGHSQNLIAPFGGASLSREKEMFNRRMSRVRVSVEWTFGKVLQYFSYTDYTKNQRLLQRPLGQQYFVSMLLNNLHTCYFRTGSVVSHFKLEPPTAAEYLRNVKCIRSI